MSRGISRYCPRHGYDRSRESVRCSMAGHGGMVLDLMSWPLRVGPGDSPRPNTVVITRDGCQGRPSSID